MFIFNDNRQFEDYLRTIMKYANKGKISRAFTEIENAKTIKTLSLSQQWLLKYYERLLILLHTQNWDWDEMRSGLSRLRTDAVPLLGRSSEAEEDILKEYIHVLYHLLSMNALVPTDLSDYKEVAVEFFELVQAVDYSEFTDEDLYSFACNIMGAICRLKGQILLEEKYLDIVYKESKKKSTISVYGIIGLYNLAETKSLLRKWEEMAEIHLYLLDILLGDKEIEGPFYDLEQTKHLLQRILQLSVLGLVSVTFQSGKPEMALNMLDTVMFQTNIIQNQEYNDYVWMMCTDYLSIMNVLHRKIEPEKIVLFEKVMQEVKEEQLHTEISYRGMERYYVGCYLLAKAVGDTAATRYIDRAMEIALNENIAEQDKAVWLADVGSAITIYRMENRYDKVWICSENILNNLIHLYSTAELAKDNEELDTYLSMCNDAFMSSYAAVMEYASLQKRLEYRMNYKNMLSSVIRFRNQLEDVYIREKREDEFPFYTFEQLCKAIPGKAVIIDFFFFNSDSLNYDAIIRRNQYYDKAELETIIIAKDENEAVLMKSARISDITYLNERLSEFHQRIRLEKGKYTKVAKDIFSLLFNEFTEEFNMADKIFISPDYLLNDLPFDLLFEAAGVGTMREMNEIEKIGTMREMNKIGTMGEVKEFIYIDSLRSLFEISEEILCIDRACVIGAPEYGIDTDSGEASDNDERDMSGRKQRLPQLPYSGYEAKIVSEKIKGNCFIGKNATKYILKNGYRYIHIATHGLVPENYENAWYETKLAFSGAEDFLMAGQEKEIYGNGILSAEEISKINLSGTELVVLSACDSGRNLLSKYMQQSGLNIAFGAAGVKYIIAALWKVDDLAAVFFMRFFYDELKSCHSVPRALGRAKVLLKNITAGEMAKTIEKDRERYLEISDELVETMNGLPKDYCLYNAPYFWDAFVCYQYRF